MSDTPKLKIEYPNKSNAYRVDNTTQAVTAENMNEIKEVVNNISDQLDNLNMFSDLMKYVRFVVPDFIELGEHWDFEVELSKDRSFSTKQTLKISTDKSKFYIFKNGTWQSLTNAYIEQADVNASIKVDVKSIIDASTNGIPFFGRYRWKMGNTEKAWKGFVLGSYGYFNEEAEQEQGTQAGGNGVGPYDRVEIRCTTVNDNHIVNEKTSKSYELYGIKSNGTAEKITSGITWISLYDNTVSQSSGTATVQFKKTHSDVIDMIIATVTIDNYYYEAGYNVVVKAIILERIQIGSIANELYDGDTCSVTVTAFYSDGSSQTVTSNAILTLSLGTSTISNGTITASGTRDVYGTLVAEYADSDFQNSEVCRDVRYIRLIKNKIESVTGGLGANTYNSNTSSNGITYSLSGTNTKGVTSTISTGFSVTLVNGDEFTASGGRITLKQGETLKETKTVTVIFKYVTDAGTLFDVKQFNVTAAASSGSGSSQSAVELTDFDVTFSRNNVISGEFVEKQTINYNLTATLSDNTNITTGFTTEVVCYSPRAIVNTSNKTIALSNFRTNETVVLKFRVTYNGKVLEKIFAFLVKSTNLKSIGLRNAASDFIVSGGQYSNTYTLSAEYTNDVTSGNLSFNGQNSKISFMAGNPDVLSGIENGRIGFTNNLSKSEETLAFVAEYKDADFDDEVASKIFTVKVLKVGGSGGSASAGVPVNGGFYKVAETADPAGYSAANGETWADWTKKYYYVGSLSGVSYFVNGNKYVTINESDPIRPVGYVGWMTNAYQGTFNGSPESNRCGLGQVPNGGSPLSILPHNTEQS